MCWRAWDRRSMAAFGLIRQVRAGSPGRFAHFSIKHNGGLPWHDVMQRGRRRKKRSGMSSRGRSEGEGPAKVHRPPSTAAQDASTASRTLWRPSERLACHDGVNLQLGAALPCCPSLRCMRRAFSARRIDKTPTLDARASADGLRDLSLQRTP